MPTLKSSRGDHTIAYDDLGRAPNAAPVFVLLPGWCNPRRFLSPLAARLAETHRVLLVDLPGHGDSTTPSSDFTSEDVVADVRAVIDAAGAETIVPVGLANAGWFGLEIARRDPARVRALVSLTWSLCELPSFFRMALEGLQSPEDWQETRDMFFGMWFQHGKPELIAWVMEEMGKFDQGMWSRSGREVAAAFAAHGSPVRFNNQLPKPVPLLHLFCRPGLPEEFLAMHRAQVNPNAWYQEKIFDQPWAFPSYEGANELAQVIEPFVAARAG